MAINPMQKKARNSFILGMLITFVIMGMLVAVLMIQIKNMKEAEAKKDRKKAYACVLSENVKSGEIITDDMVKRIEVFDDMLPGNGTNSFDNIENFFLEDRSGNKVYRKDDKSYIEINEKIYEIKAEEETEYTYIIKEVIINDQKQKVKEYIELTTPALIAKIDMEENTVLTPEMIVASNEKTTDDLRLYEYNMISLFSKIEPDDYIDIRLRLPSGEDFVVVSKKKVDMPIVNDVPSLNSIWLKLKEEELLTMSSAIVESYMIEGSMLYTAKYIEPGMQEKSIPTYIPSEKVKKLILDEDSNILEKAKEELRKRFSNSTIRENIQEQIDNQDEFESKDKVVEKTEEELTKKQEERTKYLDSLIEE